MKKQLYNPLVCLCPDTQGCYPRFQSMLFNFPLTATKSQPASAALCVCGFPNRKRQSGADIICTGGQTPYAQGDRPRVHNDSYHEILMNTIQETAEAFLGDESLIEKIDNKIETLLADFQSNYGSMENFYNSLW